MTPQAQMSTPPPGIHPGDILHAEVDGLTVPTSTAFMATGRVLRRGETFTVTADMLDATRDRIGASWLDIVDDEPAQVERWGRVQVRRGPAPESLQIPEPGTPEHREAREEARRAAWALPTSRERWEALRNVEATYGPPEPTSTILGRYRPDDDRSTAR